VDEPCGMRQGARGVPSRVPLICLIVFAVVWTALAVSPRFREDWLLDRRANYAGTTMR
jgi:hypothetical protein